MAFEFNSATFEMIQGLIFPLVAQLTGFDPAAWTGDKAELFTLVGDAFGDVSALFLVVGSALEDGRLSAAEIDEIIAKAKDLPEAIDSIVGFFEDDVVDPPVDPVQ